ncbi:MAG: FkbM family methyltransferase, partial [Pseudorhodoplanes sp.]|nr:FkbM family methyltransferase [Pseudorhodoplanes sp.]
MPVGLTIEQRIGGHGPFRLSANFAFSDFQRWGGDHNGGFQPLLDACNGASCVFDVGAHIGLVTLPASRVLAAGGRLYAFEPASANLRYLRTHLRANEIENVEVIPILLGAVVTEEVAFFEQAQATGMNSIIRPRSAGEY